jgi:hypothetical protein
MIPKSSFTRVSIVAKKQTLGYWGRGRFHAIGVKMNQLMMHGLNSLSRYARVSLSYRDISGTLWTIALSLSGIDETTCKRCVF